VGWGPKTLSSLLEVVDKVRDKTRLQFTRVRMKSSMVSREPVFLGGGQSTKRRTLELTILEAYVGTGNAVLYRETNNIWFLTKC